MEEAIRTLQARYAAAVANDCQRLCAALSERTFNLGQFVDEARYRASINDETTFWSDYNWVVANYGI